MEGKRRKVGYWMTEKKYRRLHFEDFVSLCSNVGIDLVKIDFDRPLDEQGPFSVILHKLTDQMSRVQDGSMTHIDIFQLYTKQNPETIVIDPINNVMRLLDRRHQYTDVRDCDVLETNYRYFIPSFVELTSSDVNENRRLLLENDVRFPIVCKPSVSHLFAMSPSSVEKEEQMAIIFNERGLEDITSPCVAQTFVNHNARLFKIFVVGQKHFIIQRPSIKNFYHSSHEKTIFFNSNDVSKSNSSCFLNQLDELDLLSHPLIEPDCKKMEQFVRGIQKKFGLDLLGIDVIIENDTGRYAVIDINAFPGYDGVPEFFSALLSLIREKISLFNDDGSTPKFPSTPSPLLLPSFNGDAHHVDPVNSRDVTSTNQDTTTTTTTGTKVDYDDDDTKSSSKQKTKRTNCTFVPMRNRFIYESNSFPYPALCVCYDGVVTTTIERL
jgi:inositol-1,3,4-trisphosphate 5/6-kinase/inositol-tetrakisphosphate 1-kinase